MNRDYRDYPASIWDAIGDVDQGICCAALGGVRSEERRVGKEC